MHISEALIVLAALITLTSVATAAFVTGLAGTIVYSWWRKLQVQKDQLPELLQDEIRALAAQVIQPHREVINQHGRAETLPSEKADQIDLEEEFNDWVARP